MKVFLVSLGIFILSSCYYSDGCVYTPQMVNCHYRDVYPDLIRFSKKEHATNKEERISDVLECGGTIDNGWILKNLPKKDGVYYNLEEKYRFLSCMKDKNYIFIDEYSCWKKGNL